MARLEDGFVTAASETHSALCAFTFMQGYLMSL
jgi:hypothetical protein